MQGTLQVTPEKLIAASQEFSSSSSTVRGLTSQMVSIVDGLSGIWTGEASTAYKTKFHQLDDDIERMNKKIQEHVQDLQEMARIYQAGEEAAKNASSGLPTDPMA